MQDEYDVVDTSLKWQSFPEYYTTLTNFADSLDACEDYNTNRPAHVHPGQKFRDHVIVMKEYGIGADRGDSLLKEQRQKARDLSELDLFASVCYVKTIAIHKKDPSILHTLHLPTKNAHKILRKTGSKKQLEIRLTLKHLRGVSGAIVLEGKHIRNGGPYLVDLCKGEPSEQNWYSLGSRYTSCTRIVVRGLEPANRYYVRMRTDGPDGPGDWTQPASIIVL
ncbi:MAG TPA: fibronectin type III domain-containing protein [Geomonas sp.]|nr:fibronectin type III domain-containing protein [Geomonas sp.]